MRMLHVGLRVADLERSLAFYSGLGYGCSGKVPKTEFGGRTMLRLPGDEFVTLELVHDAGRGGVAPGGLNHFVVRVESNATPLPYSPPKESMSNRPGRPTAPTISGPAWLSDPDPDGHRIELALWPSGHPHGLTEADMSGQVARD